MSVSLPLSLSQSFSLCLWLSVFLCVCVSLPLHSLVVVPCSNSSGGLIAFRVPLPEPKWGLQALRALPRTPVKPPTPVAAVDPAAYKVQPRHRLAKRTKALLPNVPCDTFDGWKSVGAALYLLAPLALESRWSVAATFGRLNAQLLKVWVSWSQRKGSWTSLQRRHGFTDEDLWALCVRHWTAFGGSAGVPVTVDDTASVPSAAWDRAWLRASEAHGLLASLASKASRSDGGNRGAADGAGRTTLSTTPHGQASLGVPVSDRLVVAVREPSPTSFTVTMRVADDSDSCFSGDDDDGGVVSVTEPWWVLQLQVVPGSKVFHTAHCGPTPKCRVKGVRPGMPYVFRCCVFDVAGVPSAQRNAVVAQLVADPAAELRHCFHLCTLRSVAVDTLDVPPPARRRGRLATQPCATRVGAVPWRHVTLSSVPLPPTHVRQVQDDVVRGHHWLRLVWDHDADPLSGVVFRVQVRRQRGASGSGDGATTDGAVSDNATSDDDGDTNYPVGTSWPSHAPSAPPRHLLTASAAKTPLSRTDADRPPLVAPHGTQWPSAWVTVYTGSHKEAGFGWFPPGVTMHCRVAAVSDTGHRSEWSAEATFRMPVAELPPPHVEGVGTTSLTVRWVPYVDEDAAAHPVRRGWSFLDDDDHDEPATPTVPPPATPAVPPSPARAGPTEDDKWYPHWCPTELAKYWFQPSTGSSSWDPVGDCASAGRPAPDLVPEHHQYREVWHAGFKLCYFVHVPSGKATWRAPRGIGCPAAIARGEATGLSYDLSMSAASLKHMLASSSSPPPPSSSSSTAQSPGGHRGTATQSPLSRRSLSPAADRSAPASTGNPPRQDSRKTVATATLGAFPAHDGAVGPLYAVFMAMRDAAGTATAFRRVWTGGDTFTTLTGLLPNCDILVKVAVVGTPLLSTAVCATTLPLPPGRLRVVAARRDGSMDVAWDAPQAGGCAAFKLVVSRADGPKAGCVAHTSHCRGDYRGTRVAGLVHGAKYTVALWAENKAAGSSTTYAALETGV